jgi:hypothetical protein
MQSVIEEADPVCSIVVRYEEGVIDRIVFRLRTKRQLLRGPT